jgi:hypothetical protein
MNKKDQILAKVQAVANRRGKPVAVLKSQPLRSAVCHQGLERALAGSRDLVAKVEPQASAEVAGSERNSTILETQRSIEIAPLSLSTIHDDNGGANAKCSSFASGPDW